MTVSLQSTFGSAFVGLVVSAVLYGVTILQTYLYYRNYQEDSKILKWMVAILWLLDTSHLVLCTISVYTVLVLNFDKPNILTTTTWSMNVYLAISSLIQDSRDEVQTDLNGLIGLIVECFYARRVWIVSRNIYLTILILVLSVVHFGLGIVFTIGSFQTNRMQFSHLIWVTSAGLGSAAAADMLIGISLCYYLSKSRTGISRTDNLIGTLMKYSLTTGFLTGIIACLVVLTFGIMPNNFVYVAFFWLLGKCYVNSVLAALNSRESFRERVQPNNTFMNLSAIVVTSPASDSSRTRPSFMNIDHRILSKTDLSPPPSAL